MMKPGLLFEKTMWNYWKQYVNTKKVTSTNIVTSESSTCLRGKNGPIRKSSSYTVDKHSRHTFY